VKLQLFHWTFSVPSRAEVLHHCATGAGLVAVNRPIERLSRCASLTLVFVAAALLAACGGGGGDAGAAVDAAPIASSVGISGTAEVTGVGVPVAPTASNVAISGTAQVGQLLTGTYTYADANNDPQGASIFRWLRSGAAIAGATASTYKLVGADLGKTIKFKVTPVSTVAPTTGTPVASSPTAEVTGVGVPVAPTASNVAISGTAQVGQLLTGTYTYADANNDPQGTSTFRWLRSGAAIAGARASTYTLVGADLGKTIKFKVTPVSTVAPKTGNPVVSSPTAAVTGVSVPVAPTASSVAISGTAQVGQLLTGTYTYADANNDPQGASIFRWLRNGSVAIATASSYTLVGADQGSTITFEVTPVSTVAPSTGTPVTSSPTAEVAGVGIPAAPTASNVAISGTAQVGQLLTGTYTYADANNDPQGTSILRWLRGGVPIAGATAGSYTLVGADQGKTIQFEVTPVASTGTPASGTAVTSMATAVVAGVGVPAAPTASNVAISGTAQVGQLLTGTYTYADANNDQQGTSIFRWLRSGAAIAGATAGRYTLVGADQGNTITFEVTPVSTVAPTIGTPVASSPTVAVSAATSNSVGMKLLVISAVGTAPSYLGITSILDQIGVPYDKIVLKGTTPTALQMVAGTLSDGAGNGKYQGIILETGDLAAYNAPTNNYPSAMTAAQWAMLRQYQHDFGVRSATMYTRPASTIDVNSAPLDLTYGLALVSARSTNDYTTPADTPVTATFTPTGAGLFSYLNSANPVIIKNAYTYLSTPVAGTQTTPLLTAIEGGNTYAIASTYTGAGWENLAISADGNPELTHSLLLGYGIVNWVTKGVFLGERKIYLSAQPDDVFISDDLWNPATKTTPNDGAPVSNPAFRHRNDATDYNSLVAWQTALRANTQTAAFRLELPFNGIGYNTTDPEYLNKNELIDTLSPAVRANPNAFRWINHTWEHTSLVREDGFTPTVSSMLQEFQWNHEVATGVRSGNPITTDPKVTFGLYNKNAFIQPDISGLESNVFWQAAQTFGFRYILMDTSRTYDFRPTLSAIAPNTGFYSTRDTFFPANPRIVIIPRYPTNLFYNVSTPDEWLSEYNHFYAPGGLWPTWDRPLIYAELLDKESDTLVRYMLKYNANSWMFHAANLRDYDGAGPNNKSLLSDLLDAVTNKFKAMYKLPVLSPSQTEIGQIMEARMTYNTAIAGGLKGRIVSSPSGTTIELNNLSGVSVVVPVTGVNVGGTSYGEQTISTFQLAAGGSTAFAAP
jgi:hypothetical protein